MSQMLFLGLGKQLRLFCYFEYFVSKQQLHLKLVRMNAVHEILSLTIKTKINQMKE